MGGRIVGDTTRAFHELLQEQLDARGDMFQGFLHVRNAQTDRDGQGRPIVPRQEFVMEHGVRTVLGMGTGYASHPTLATLFAFTNEDLPDPPIAPLSRMLEAFVTSTESLVRQGHLFG